MIAYGMPASGPLEQTLWEQGLRLGLGELLSLKYSHDFERMTTPGTVREGLRIMGAEKDAGTYDPDYALASAGLAEVGAEARHAYAMTEAEYKASAWYRTRPDGKAAMEYTPDMTPQRAEILAEIYDRRRHEEQILDRSTDTALRHVLVFGASMLAQLPDPINLIPVGGAAAKGAGLAARVGRGMLQGATGAAVADSVMFPAANARGEDFTFFDAALDITFGAAFGGGIGALGFGVSRIRDRRQAARLRSETDALAGELALFWEESGTFNRETSLPAARQVVDAMAAMQDGLAQVKQVRSMLGGESRAAEGAVMDRALKALSDGEDFDAAAWRKQTGLQPSPLPHVRTADLIASGERPDWGDLTLTEMLPLAKEFYTKNLKKIPVVSQGREVIIRSHHKGWGKIRGLTPEADKLKLLPYIDRILKEAEWVFTDSARREKHAELGMKVHYLLSRVEYRGKMLEARMVVREDRNGKMFYDFFNETEAPSPLMRDTPPESPDSSAGSLARGGGGTGSVYHDRSPRQTDGLVTETPGSDITIPRDGDSVNLEVRDVTPDPERPAPLPDYRAPEPDGTPEAELRSRGIDPKTGRGFDEVEARRLEEEGKVTPEDADALRAAVAEYERIEAREEAALSIVGCIAGGV
jgi:hypothetical protein